LEQYFQDAVLGTKDPSGELALQIKDISHSSSLGYHPLALIKLESGQLVLFSETYPSLNIPCNGARADSLYEIGASSGPQVGAIELNVEIVGVTNLDQIRAVRRIRPILPELIKVQVAQDCVTLTHNRANRATYSEKRRLIMNELDPCFANPAVKFVELKEQDSDAAGLLKLTRPALLKIFHKAWDNEKDNSTKHIQSFSLDVNAKELVFIEQGPANPRAEKKIDLQLTKGLSFCSNRTRYDGQVWQDSARAYLLGCQRLPENLRITTHGHEMCVTALINPEDPWLPKRAPGQNRLPYEVRPFSFDNSDYIAREIFELLPRTGALKVLSRALVERRF